MWASGKTPVSFLAAPPDAETTNTPASSGAAAYRTNAMRDPSGDQHGLPSETALAVTRRGSPPPTALVYTLKTPAFSPSQTNATRVPSGENAGSYWPPGNVVKGEERSA